MKKRIVVLLLMSSFLIVRSVSARSFNENYEYAHTFRIDIPNSKTVTKSFIKITDEQDTPYYNVYPHVSFYSHLNNYEEKQVDMSLDKLQGFSKISYFGYGYQGKKTDAYYFATQFLMYQLFSNHSTIYQLQGESEDFLAPVIAEIEANINNVTFSLKDFVTKNTTYEITDPYIVDNFIVQGEHTNVTYEDKKIIIQFLDHRKEYILDFQPKNKCANSKVWKAGAIQLFKRSEVCEQNYQVKVTYQEEEKEEKPSTSTSQNNAKKENLQKTTQKEKKESIEVKVPSTGKNGFPYSILLCLIGVIVCVLKK